MAPNRSPRHLAARCAAACALLAAACLALGGCAWQAGDHVPSLSALPLVSGTHVTLDHRVCDPGAHAYCALELMVVGPHYASAKDLVRQEHHLVDSLGWHDVNAPTGLELEADSPGDKLRVTYATPFGDGMSVAIGWIKRSRAQALALSQAMSSRSTKTPPIPTMSMLLQLGAG